MSLAPRRMMPFHSWSVPGRKPGTSTNVSTGMLNASQVRTKRAAFSAALMSSVPAIGQRLVGDDPDGVALDVPEPDEHVLGVQRLDLEQDAVVQHVLQDRAHVVRLAVRVGQERVERLVVLGDLQVGLVVERHRVGEVVLRQVVSSERT